MCRKLLVQHKPFEVLPHKPEKTTLGKHPSGDHDQNLVTPGESKTRLRSALPILTDNGLVRKYSFFALKTDDYQNHNTEITKLLVQYTTSIPTQFCHYYQPANAAVISHLDYVLWIGKYIKINNISYSSFIPVAMSTTLNTSWHTSRN